MKIKKVLKFYILLIIFHFLHIIEEIIGGASFIDNFYGGVGNFIIVMGILFIIPVLLLYFTLRKNRLTYYLSYVYAVIMIIDGLEHMIGFTAGAYTGIGLIILGALLSFSLWRNR